MITAITCTGSRHVVFKLCEQWMSRQTVKVDQWIVVDDGTIPTQMCLGQQYIRREPRPDDPPHTLGLNILAALPHIKGDKILFIEDDDYYKPNYVEVMSKWLDSHHLVGQANAIYYNLKYRWWHQHPNTKHASLCQTGCTTYMLKYLEPLCKQDLRFIDIEFWNKSLGRKFIDTSFGRMCIGLKGLPGRQGIGMGHDEKFPNDPDFFYFKNFLGEDANVYFKLLNIEPPDTSAFPDEIMRCRRDGNGRLRLPKPNKRLEAILDAHCIRVDHLTWEFKTDSFRTNINDMKGKYSGKPCYIIGKGPSLDTLKPYHFIQHDAPIIALNESIHEMERMNINNDLYCIQQDSVLKEGCWSKRGTMLIPYITSAWYTKHPRVKVFNPNDFGLPDNFHPQSVIIGIHFAKYWGCSKLIMMCFDAYINDKVGYAKCIGYDPSFGGEPDRFLLQKKTISDALIGVEHEFRHPDGKPTRIRT